MISSQAHAIQQDYSGLWSLDPEVALLNHGSFGACPIPILEHQQSLRLRMERQPVAFFDRQLGPMLDAARAELAEFVGAPPSELCFVPNATTGVNAVLRSLALKPGDELLVTDHEYNACRNALDFVATRAGARVVVAPIPFPGVSPDKVVTSVLDRVTSRTRLALIDHVTSATGLVLPIEPLVAELDDRGIDTLVDGAHAPGMLPLSLSRLGAAYYTGNCHKWLCTPKGAGLLYVRSDRQLQVRPTVISHGANLPDDGRGRFHLEFDWTGTYDPTPYLGVPEAIRLFGEVFPGGWPAMRERNRALALSARRLLCNALGISLPAPDSMIGSLASVPLPDSEPGAVNSPRDRDPLQEALLESYAIEVPVFPWPHPPRRLLRISVQLYNRPDQYTRLASALESIL